MSKRDDQVHSATVAILLCTYYGQQYLREQLESFSAQSHSQWKVCASDDGSQDATYAILEEYQRKWGEDRLSLHAGPARGFVANFLAVTCEPSIQADFYAYADQDDVWEPDKLARALRWLAAVPKDTPALYCSRTRLVDAGNQDIGFSPLFTKPPSFSNALVQNIGGGNTMVFNNALRNLLCMAGDDLKLITHDWWVYLVVSGCGGKVFYDPYPSTRYRQHGKNLIGSNLSMGARLIRLRLLLQGRFRKWTEQNVSALQRIRSRLTPENRRLLDDFSSSRHRWLLPRLLGIRRCRIYRQTLLGNLGLFTAALLNKM